MKLAFVHKRYSCDGGTERMLYGLARGLVGRGHQVDVLCTSHDPRLVAEEGVCLRSLPAGGPGSFLRTIALFIAARVATQDAGYDLVVHFGRTGPGDVYRSGGGCHRRWLDLVGEARGFWTRLALRLSPRHQFLLWHERAALRSSGSVVVPSEQARGELIDTYGAAARSVRVLSNGVDLERFCPGNREQFFSSQRAELGLKEEDRVLLFIGSDYWRKGLDRVLAALGVLAKEGTEFWLLVAGGDRRQGMFEGIARRLGIAHRVRFLGAVERPEGLYAAADLLVLPTRHDPFANVTLEALASGVPVLTSMVNGAIGSMPHSPGLAVVQGECEAVVTASEISAMMDLAAWDKRSEAARGLAERFGASEMTSRWEDFLRDQIQRRRSCA